MSETEFVSIKFADRNVLKNKTKTHSPSLQVKWTFHKDSYEYKCYIIFFQQPMSHGLVLWMVASIRTARNSAQIVDGYACAKTETMAVPIYVHRRTISLRMSTVQTRDWRKYEGNVVGNGLVIKNWKPRHQGMFSLKRPIWWWQNTQATPVSSILSSLSSIPLALHPTIF